MGIHEYITHNYDSKFDTPSVFQGFFLKKSIKCLKKVQKRKLKRFNTHYKEYQVKSIK
jgi:hypothetical protein